MNKSPLIVLVSTLHKPEHIDAMEQRLNAEVAVFDDIRKMFAALGTTIIHPDLIILGLKSLRAMEGIDVFNVIGTTSTLSQINIGNTGAKWTASQPSPIAMIVYPGEDVKTLKALIGAGIKGIIPGGPTFTYDEKEEAARALLAGERYMPKDILDRLCGKVKKRRHVSLTPRQQQVLSLIRDRGVSNKVIARTLNISESAVKQHMSSIMRKFGVHNRTQLAVLTHSPT